MARFEDRLVLPLMFSLLICLMALSIYATGSEATYVDTDITSDTTWTPPGNPWIVRRSIDIHDGATLSIMPGAVVRIEEGVSIGCLGSGRIRANGVDDDIIKFLANRQPGREYGSIETGVGE